MNATGGQVTNVTGLRLLVIAIAGFGGALLWRRDRPLGQVWLAAGVLPFVLAAVIGFVSPFLIDRTLTVAAWAGPLALGVALDAAIRHGGRVIAVLVIVVLAFAGLASVSAVAGTDENADHVIAHLIDVVRPGDVVATLPARLGTLTAYRIGIERGQQPRPVPVPGLRGATVFRIPRSPRRVGCGSSRRARSPAVHTRATSNAQARNAGGAG